MNKRDKVEAYVIKLMKQVDQYGGNNAERYMELFADMNNAKFDLFMQNLKDGNTQLYVVLPNMSDDMNVDEAMELAKKRKVEIFSRIYFRDISTGRKYLTKYKFLVVKLPVRRLSQYLFHKISLPEGDRHINPVSGQVIRPDKGAALSSIEVQILASKGLESSIIELVKTRGGDTNAYNALKYQLEEEGVSSLAELPMENKPRSVTTTSLFLRSLGLSNNL